MGIRTRTSGIHTAVWVLPPTTPLQDLVSGLQADGIWTKLDRLWIFAQSTEVLALVDLVVSASATAVNSPTFTANRGYTGVDNSNTIYIDSNFNYSTSGVTYTQDSAHISCWVATYTTGTGFGHMGDGGGGTETNFVFNSADNLAARVNDNPSSLPQGVPATKTGYWLLSRTGAAATTLYQNGASFSTPNATSGALKNLNLYILAANFSGVPAGSPQQLAMVSIGGSLSAANATAFYNRLRTYMTAVGVP